MVKNVARVDTLAAEMAMADKVAVGTMLLIGQIKPTGILIRPPTMIQEEITTQ